MGAAHEAILMLHDDDWKLKPAHRRTDPLTSKEADEEVTQSGRRLTQAQRLLERLQKGPATTLELANICLQYGRRVSDLRQQGYVVVAKPIDGGIYEYTLGERNIE